MNGFAAALTPQEARALARLPAVVSVRKDELSVRLFTTHSPQFLGLPGRAAWGALNGSEHAGEDMVVGVVDTGINIDSPAFDGAGYGPPPASWNGSCDFPGSACNNKVIGARFFHRGFDFFGDVDTARDPLSPRDVNGH
eukprot:jgi/Mesen1/114/ME1123223C07606